MGNLFDIENLATAYIAKLTPLTLLLCLLMVPNDVCTHRMVTIFQSCLSLQALEIVYGYTVKNVENIATRRPTSVKFPIT